MSDPEIVNLLMRKDERIASLEAENNKLKNDIQKLLTYVQEMREQGYTDLRQIIYTIQTILE